MMRISFITCYSPLRAPVQIYSEIKAEYKDFVPPKHGLVSLLPTPLPYCAKAMLVTLHTLPLTHDLPPFLLSSFRQLHVYHVR